MPPSSPRLPPEPRNYEARLHVIERRLTEESNRRIDLEHRLEAQESRHEKLRGSLSDVPEHLRQLRETIGTPPHLGTPGTGLTGYVMGVATHRDSQITALITQREKAKKDAADELEMSRKLWWDKAERIFKTIGTVAVAIAIFEGLRRLIGG